MSTNRAPDVISGLLAMPRAVAYLARVPRLIPWVLAPTLLTLACIVVAIVTTLMWAPDLVYWMVPRPTSGSLILWRIGTGLLTATLLVASVAVAWVVGNMASAPFYDVIAGTVEARELGTKDEDFALSRVFADAWLSIQHSAVALVLYLVVIVLLLALNLVPVVGSVLNAVLGPLVTVFFVAREVMDVPLSRRRLCFRDKLRYLSDNRWPIGGHGAVVSLFLLIPLANLVITPLAVLGAALVFCDIERASSLDAVGS